MEGKKKKGYSLDFEETAKYRSASNDSLSQLWRRDLRKQKQYQKQETEKKKSKKNNNKR